MLENKDELYECARLFAKYTWNRVNFDIFKELMQDVYEDEGYLMEKFEHFKKNPLMFIVARDEKFLFDRIIEKINQTNYKG